MNEDKAWEILGESLHEIRSFGKTRIRWLELTEQKRIALWSLTYY
jgi:hypothetical protein